DQPMVKSMFQGRRPSYVPARTFSLALWNMATAAAEGTPSTIAGVTKDIRLLRSAITTMPPEVLPDDLKGALITLIDEAGGDYDADDYSDDHADGGGVARDDGGCVRARGDPDAEERGRAVQRGVRTD